MEFLKKHPRINRFLSEYPTNKHEACVLNLCLLGLDALQGIKFERRPLSQPSLTEKTERTIDEKISSMKNELSLINASFPNKNPSVPIDVSIVSTEESPRAGVKHTEKNEGSRMEKRGSVIEIADSFFNIGLVKDIYQKEVIEERLKVPFRKKWEEACKQISLNCSKDVLG